VRNFLGDDVFDPGTVSILVAAEKRRPLSPIQNNSDLAQGP
jgi:hypothetical protein